MATRANRLSRETSPYLLQHAHNPVDWFPWGADALARARSEDRPILLSIGYAACHWCHVMERESFEDDATARLMNEHFVCIKVDREERPDLDDIYMAATIAMTGHGGWPMTVFLTPEQKPFFAGTYFPPQDAHGRPGFKTLLSRIAEVWTEDRAGIERQAGQLTQQVTAQLGHTCPQAVSDDTLSLAARQLRAQYDPRWGGFGGAPKFPPCSALHLLLRHHLRTGDARSVEMVRGTLDAMHDGGIFDHVGGGFARYSTDERWHVPHFEKMLYDNGQLARVYVEAFQATGEERYALVARRTLDYLLREMQSESGAFYSATDADSEGVEGRFFVFTPAEIITAVGEQDAPAVCAFFDVRDGGNWEGHNVLWTPRPAGEVAETLGMSEEALRARVERALPLLYEARARRVPPLLDDKVLVSWNALAIGALALAAQVLNEPRYLGSAERAASDLWQRLRDTDGRLLRTARGEGPAHLTAYLEDYAYLGDALIDLYEAGAPFVWLERSHELSGFVLAHFGSDRGAFHHTADDHESLLTRSLDGQDGAMPSANAVCARMLLRLSSHLGEPDLEVKARAALEAFGELVERAPRAFATTLAALDMLAHPAVEIALVGQPGEALERLERAVAACPLPRRVLARGLGDDSDLHPMLRGKTPVGGQPAVYLCRNFACEAPLTEAAGVREALRGCV